MQRVLIAQRQQPTINTCCQQLCWPDAQMKPAQGQHRLHTTTVTHTFSLWNTATSYTSITRRLSKRAATLNTWNAGALHRNIGQCIKQRHIYRRPGLRIEPCSRFESVWPQTTRPCMGSAARVKVAIGGVHGGSNIFQEQCAVMSCAGTKKAFSQSRSTPSGHDVVSGQMR